MNEKNRRYIEAGPCCSQRTVDFVVLVLDENMFEIEYEALFGLDSAVAGLIQKNVGLGDKLKMIALRGAIGRGVPNFCTGKPNAIAAWSSADHVESLPKKKALPPPPTA
ncbi:MAG: hypothetical protein IPN69_03610 [Acidobacteria bacterium]|nr:hypothetical protein [Acidobacteriota bacterium]